jgi:hypothetical protein
MLQSWRYRLLLALLTFLGGLSVAFQKHPGWVGLLVVVGLASAFFELGQASEQRRALGVPAVDG